jgi:hypothetical protein
MVAAPTAGATVTLVRRTVEGEDDMSELKYTVCACLVGVLLTLPAARAQSPAAGQPNAQTPAHDHDHAEAPAASKPKTEHPAAPSAGAEDATTMDVEAVEAELDLLVAKMNESEGKSKLEAMEKLLTTLVREHRAGCGAAKRSPAHGASGGCCHGGGSMERPDADE